MNRSIRNLAIATIATAAIAGTALTPVIASAAETTPTDQVVQASKTGAANPDLQLSQNGFNVMREVRAARIAIFNGDTEAAKKFVDQASTDLGKVTSEDNAKADVAKITGDKNLVPIDGQLVVADNFVATKEKAEHIAKGNEHLKKGESKKALEELKLADVDIGFTRVLMPLKETTDHVTLASQLMAKGDYYQANMALKAAEDGLNVDTVMLVSAPKKGTQQQGSNGSTQQPAQKSQSNSG